jgi:hypothetical protein
MPGTQAMLGTPVTLAMPATREMPEMPEMPATQVTFSSRGGARSEGFAT